MSNQGFVGKDTVPVMKMELVIERFFPVPRDTLWQAWTDPEKLNLWWGPKGFPITTSNMRFEPGGFFHYCLSAANGQEMWGRFVFVEIIEPEKLVFISSFSDKPGGIIRNPMNLSWPLEILNEYKFTENDRGTRLVMKGTPHNATREEQKTFTENHENIKKGFAGTFEQLDEFLAASEMGGG